MSRIEAMTSNTMIGMDVMVLALVCALLGIGLRAVSTLGRRELRTMWFFVVLGLVLLVGANLEAYWREDALSTGLVTAAGLVTDLAFLQLALVVLFQWLMPAIRLRAPRIAQDLTFTALAIGGALYGLSQVGVDPGKLFTTSAILTAVIAFAMQDTLGNILGGVVLQLDDSLKIGEMVRIDDAMGKVIDVRWRYTAIENKDGETIIIPNSWLMKNRFRVLRSHGEAPLIWRRTLAFNIDSAALPSRVIKVMNQAVSDARIPLVSRDKTNSAVLSDVTAGYCRYSMRYWLTDPDADSATDSQVRMHVLAALEREGIRLGAPKELQQMTDNSADSAIDGREHDRRLKAVADSELFASLTADAQNRLAHELVRAPFVKGGVITRQGATAHWLYLIVDGSAEVVTERGGVSTPVAKLSAGDYFGEMGLLTGESRSATVYAVTDVECYRLDKEGFGDVLRTHPSVAQAVAAALNQRRADTSQMVRLAQGEHESSSGGDLLARIRNFFHIG